VSRLNNHPSGFAVQRGTQRRVGDRFAVAALLSGTLIATVLSDPADAEPSLQISANSSLWGMFQHADPVVQAVMLGLVLASLLTWSIWIAKTQELRRARKRLLQAVISLEAASGVSQVKPINDVAVNAMIETAQKELSQSVELIRSGQIEGVKERAAVRLQRIEAAAARQVNRGIGVLASIGSTAPFVGLFGTVWGIMHSFVSIAGARSASLAVVAPGISEALLATALGLVAAVPATLIFNGFARSLGDFKALLADSSTLVLCLLSREVDMTAVLPAEKPKMLAGAAR
jgi:biopolymer transport protein ExbB